jgi:hypothetical protein
MVDFNKALIELRKKKENKMAELTNLIGGLDFLSDNLFFLSHRFLPGRWFDGVAIL